MKPDNINEMVRNDFVLFIRGPFRKCRYSDRNGRSMALQEKGHISKGKDRTTLRFLFQFSMSTILLGTQRTASPVIFNVQYVLFCCRFFILFNINFLQERYFTLFLLLIFAYCFLINL